MDPTIPAGSDDILSAFANMSDADLQRLLKTSNTANRSALVQQQLDAANKLIDQGIGDYRSPMGAALGGLAGVLRTTRGNVQAKDAQAQQQALMAGLEDPRTARLTTGAPMPQPAAPAAPATPDFGASGLVGRMGGGAPIDPAMKQRLLAQLLRSSGGAGDLGGLGGLS